MVLQIELIPVLSDNYAYLLIDSTNRTLLSNHINLKSYVVPNKVLGFCVDRCGSGS